MSTPQPQALVQQKRDVASLLNSDRAKQEMAKVLPKHLTAERMTRVALTAILKTPALLNCVPESLLNAVLLCSQAGLEPDGRLAHLIPYGNQVQVIFDYKGLVTLALRNNGVDQVYGDKVCEHDEFRAWVENGEKKIEHSIDWKKPRGNPYAYYTVTRKDGITDWEVMTLDEVEAIRQRSKAKDSGPWKTDYDEMAKKTVIRRMSKRWDLLPEIREVINADDDVPAFEPKVSAPIFQPKVPSAPQVADRTPAPEPEPQPAEPEPPTPAPTAPAEPVNPIKDLRAKLREAKLKEADLIGFLTEVGSIEPGMNTLEEVQLKAAESLKMVVTQFDDIVGRIKGE